MIRPSAITLACLALLSLAQCGPTVAPATATTPAPRSTGATQVVSAAQTGALNALRAQYGLSALRPDATLGRIADLHARDMAQAGFFGHVSSNGATIVDRARGGGYAFCHVAENLAGGITSFPQVIGHWMNSPKHRANLLHSEARDFGLARGPGNTWVLVLGARGCDGSTEYDWTL